MKQRRSFPVSTQPSLLPPSFSVTINKAGIVADMRTREEQDRSYPETRAFVSLLRTLNPYMQESDPSRRNIHLYVAYILKQLVYV